MPRTGTNGVVFALGLAVRNGMNLGELVACLESIAPTVYAEDWDNVGLLAGDPAANVREVLLAIDGTPEVFDEAVQCGSQVLVAYHPALFSAVKRLQAGHVVFDAIARGMAIYSPHTALDAAQGGTNDVLADVLGLENRVPLRPSRAAHPMAPVACGMGRVGDLPSVRASALLDLVKSGLGVSHLLVAGPLARDVRRAAVCAGAIGEMLDDAIAARVDLVLTGEMRHHDALRAVRAGVTVFATLHSNSERVTLARYRDRLAREAPMLRCRVSTRDADPFLIV